MFYESYETSKKEKKKEEKKKKRRRSRKQTRKRCGGDMGYGLDGIGRWVGHKVRNWKAKKQLLSLCICTGMMEGEESRETILDMPTVSIERVQKAAVFWVCFVVFSFSLSLALFSFDYSSRLATLKDNINERGCQC